MKKDKGRKKWGMVVLAVLAVGGVSIGSTYAMLKQHTEEKVNTFRSGIVNIVIREAFQEKAELPHTGEKVKKSVFIQNTDAGEDVLKDRIVPVYIRASLVPQWKDKNGNLLPVDVKHTAFELQLDDAANGWVKGDDGYFYYTKIVDPKQETGELLASVSVASAENIPDGAHLEVEVLADAVQAQKNAREEAWGTVKVKGQTISFQDEVRRVAYQK
ncbi:MAG: hypothetical protein ACI4HI_18095 [Lachnospiraceae bacterium]